MRRRFCWLGPTLGTALAACLIAAGPLWAAPSGEQLLPSTAKGFVSIVDFPRLLDDWGKTQLGQLWADPIMRPFADDFQKQLASKANQTRQSLGLSWDDLHAVAAGEVALGVVQPEAKRGVVALVIDVTGRKKEAAALVARIGQNLVTVQKAKLSQFDAGGSQAMVYAIPAGAKQPARVACYCLKQDRLLACDDREVLVEMLGRFAGKSTDRLADVPAYQKTMARCQAAGRRQPDVRWFVEPFGYVEAMRVINDRKRVGPDKLAIYQQQGFGAIQGIGGYLHLATERFELEHQTAIYAPPVNPPGQERYNLAAAMLDFPNGGDFKPQPWVPRGVASYASFNVKPEKAFNASKTLIDALQHDEIFDTLLDSIKEGTFSKLDVRRDLVAPLGNRATIVFDYALPITPESERRLVAIETTNPKQSAAAIEAYMEVDPDAEKLAYHGHVIWQITNPEPPADKDKVQAKADEKKKKKDEEDDEADLPEHLLPNLSVTVAHGYLLAATHYDFLIRVLDQLAERQRLSASSEYQLVQAELDKLSGGQACAQSFSRTDETLRATYELLRTGRLPQGKTMFAGLVNRLLDDGQHEGPRKPRIEASKLPDYDAVRRYLGPGGMTAVSEDEGWFVTGFVLGKQPPAADAAAEKPTP